MLFARRVMVAEEARPALIAALDHAAERIPGDDWIVGHRVGLRIKHGLAVDALRVVDECRASPWWCHALSGFVLHVMGDAPSAEAAFEAALEGMTREERCEWEGEVLHLLAGLPQERFSRSDCDERAALSRHIWWLSDPFHLRSENERYLEHMTRLVAMRLHHQYLELEGSECGDHHGRVLRGGWPEWWWGHEGTVDPANASGYRFIPSPSILLDPLASLPGDWNLAARPWEEQYDPGYGPIHDMEQQTAFFLRGDSLLVAVAADLPGGALREVEWLEVGIVLSRHESDLPVVVREEGSPQRYGFRAMVPDDAYLVSVEAITEASGAFRSRFGHRRPDPSPEGLALSDLVLLDWFPGAEGADLEAVLPHMLGTERVDATRDVGVFWETYGFGEARALQVTLAAVPESPGILRRLGQALRILAPVATIRFTWEEGLEPAGDLARSLRLDLSRLSPGRYTLVLEVLAGSDDPVSASRRIEIVRD